MNHAKLPIVLVVLVAAIMLPGCGIFGGEKAPPDLLLACEGQGQIIEAQAQNEVDLVTQYESDLEAQLDKHAHERLDYLLATSGDTMTKAEVRALVLEFEQAKTDRMAKAARRKAAYMKTIAENAQSAKALNEATRRYIESLDNGDEATRLRAIIDAIKPKPKPQEPVVPAPSSGPAPVVPFTGA